MTFAIEATRQRASSFVAPRVTAVERRRQRNHDIPLDNKVRVCAARQPERAANVTSCCLATSINFAISGASGEIARRTAVKKREGASTAYRDRPGRCPDATSSDNSREPLPGPSTVLAASAVCSICLATREAGKDSTPQL